MYLSMLSIACISEKYMQLVQIIRRSHINEFTKLSIS